MNIHGPIIKRIEILNQYLILDAMNIILLYMFIFTFKKYRHYFKGSMPVVQKYPPANPYALVLDHDYREYTAEDEFLSKTRYVINMEIRRYFRGTMVLKLQA